ncbi:MAG: hydroxymethylglutaryl-CoA reductase [Lentimonas sp.]|jgi:hydroxymethylglutaryl-CoA reductase
MKENWTLEEALKTLEKLSSNQKPEWGTMSAQRMVEHLTDVLQIATEKKKISLLIPEEKIEKMQLFLSSDKPMARNVEVPFAKKEEPLRNSEIETAVDEFIEEWCDFDAIFSENDELKTLHPYYGHLNYKQWNRLNAKHLNHHFEQFKLV